jgi:glycerol-1-phosphate dehydrogenase [NAD(P)+]
MPHSKVDITDSMKPFLGRLTTRRVVIERETLSRCADILREELPSGRWLLVADENTYKVAGQSVEKRLSGSGIAAEVVRLEGEGGVPLVADDASVDLVLGRLVRHGPGHSAAVAIGAGTVNDIVKLAASKADIPYAVVATAPSMNGYTSSIAAILSAGVKTTQSCRPPVVCLADLDVMAQAPYRMIASGLADLISKPVSNADWHLGHRLLAAEHSPEAVTLQTAAAELTRDVAPKLVERDVEAVGRLTGALCLSGFAMDVAGSSSPASGAEHLISHYLDMAHFAWGGPHDLHGCQVGVGTITTAALYEKLQAMSPGDIDVKARVAAHVPWDAYEPILRERFGAIAQTVIGQARTVYPTREQLAERLTLVKSEWASILHDVSETLRPARDISAELAAAQCPVTFGDIGVPAGQARDAVLFSKDIRARYTVLHLAAELGTLDRWTDEVLEEHHGISRECRPS